MTVKTVPTIGVFTQKNHKKTYTRIIMDNDCFIQSNLPLCGYELIFLFFYFISKHKFFFKIKFYGSLKLISFFFEFTNNQIEKSSFLQGSA